MGFKLVALDVDGTIRTIERPLSERTRTTIDRVRETGAAVTLATGRTYRSAARAAADLDLTDPIATFQGAHVADPKSGDILWHVPLTSEMTALALEALADWGGLEVIGYLDDDVFVIEMTEWARAYGERNGVPVRVVGTEEFVSNPMTRLVVRGEDEVIERLEIVLKEQLDGEMYVTRSLSYFCEILHPRGGKDKALDWLRERMGIAQEQTIAFGNGYNDVQMLEWAHMSVAVDDAVPQVLDVADVIAPSMEEDGVAQVLEDLLDRGLIG